MTDSTVNPVVLFALAVGLACGSAAAAEPGPARRRGGPDPGFRRRLHAPRAAAGGWRGRRPQDLEPLRGLPHLDRSARGRYRDRPRKRARQRLCRQADDPRHSRAPVRRPARLLSLRPAPGAGRARVRAGLSARDRSRAVAPSRWLTLTCRSRCWVSPWRDCCCRPGRHCSPSTSG